MDTHSAILNFRDAIVTSFGQWQISANAALESDRGFLDESFGDWAQAHWELLVERVLCQPNQFLELYGSGSDFEMAAHSRVFFHDATPTHEIVCRSDSKTLNLLTGDTIELELWKFDRFVSAKGDWYDESPPFEHLLLSNANSCDNALISFTNVSFQMRAMPVAG